MRAAVLALVLIGASASAEDLTSTNGQDSVRLSSEPCSHAGTLIVWRKRIRSDVELYNARAQVRGEDSFACWAIDGDNAHIFYEDGDQGLVPLADFVPGAKRAAPKPDA